MSPGQTIKSTRGFKWNTAKNTNKDGNGNGNTNGNGFQNVNLTNDLSLPQFNDNMPQQFSTPQKQATTAHLFQSGLDHGAGPVTDFNYTPSHQRPYIQSTSGTVVSSHQDLRQIVETTLGSKGVLNQAVKLPKGENIDEWIAVHCVDFYNQINMLYGSITEFCSPQTCPRMIATNEYEYLWNVHPGKPPISLPAPKYVDYLIRWCQQQFDDESYFPSKPGAPFPKDFKDSIARPILKRLFRVYAHIYCHHFNEILELNLQTVLNTSFRHVCLFSEEFHILKTNDYGPLLELVIEFKDR